MKHFFSSRSSESPKFWILPKLYATENDITEIQFKLLNERALVKEYDALVNMLLYFIYIQKHDIKY